MHDTPQLYEGKGCGEMTLAEMIGKYDLNVKIGCKDGNAFVYCGRLNELDLKEKDYDLMNALIASATNCNKELTAIKNKLKNPDTEYQRYVEKMKAKELPYKPYGEWVEGLRKSKIKCEESKKGVLTRMLNYKKIGGREVVETYRSITEANTKIIIIEGDDIGEAGTTEEYERSKNATT